MMQTSPSEEGAGSESPPKRRNRPSRAIADLTPAQLRHKRIVDRNAQRAARQRAKNSFVELETRFHQLEETFTQQQTELACLRDQNTRLLRCLDSIHGALSEVPSVAFNSARSDAPLDGEEGRNGIVRNYELGDSRCRALDDGIPFDTQTDNSQPQGIVPLPPPASLISGSLPYPLIGDGVRNSATSSTVHNEPQSNTGQEQETATRAVFNTLPIFLPAARPLDQILLEFVTSHRQDVSSSPDPRMSLYPDEPHVQALVNVDLIHTVDPLSAIMSRVLSTFHHVKLPEKLAFFYVMYHTTKWLIQPTRGNYLSLPTWLRPTVTQITLPHAIWITNIPWPGVRDKLIEEPDRYHFEMFSELYSHTVTVNWSHDPLDALSGSGDTKTLHSIFQRHIQKIDNWTVAPEFNNSLPAMTSSIQSIP